MFGSDSEEHRFRAELGFKEKGEDPFEDFETNISKFKRRKNGGGGRREGGEANSSELLESKDEKGSGESKRSFEDENLVRFEDGNGDGDEEEEKLVRADGRMGMRKGRQVMKRSSLLAKQVISIRSALSLGFVSQLWVDTTSVSVLLLLLYEFFS